MADLAVLEVAVQRLGVRVRVNDVTQYLKHAQRRVNAAIKINPWLVPGKNPLRLDIATLPGVEGEQAPRDGLVRVAVLLTTTGQGPDGEARLIDHTASPLDLAQQIRRSWTTIFTADFDAAPLRTPARWLTFPPVPSADQAREYVRRLHALYAGRAIDGVVREMRPRHALVAEAFGRSPDSSLASFREALTTAMHAPDYHVDPLDLERISIEPEGTGRLLAFLSREGEGVIRASGGGVQLSGDLWLAYVDGAFAVVK